jgi:hypothetical protein
MRHQCSSNKQASFLSDTINLKGTLDKSLHNFFFNLSYEDRHCGSFQKDGATVHTAREKYVDIQMALKSSLKRCEAKDLKNVEVGSLLTHESKYVSPPPLPQIRLLRPRDFITLCCRSGHHIHNERKC